MRNFTTIDASALDGVLGGFGCDPACCEVDCGDESGDDSMYTDYSGGSDYSGSSSYSSYGGEPAAADPLATLLAGIEQLVMQFVRSR
jgi:hypothetical protein